MRKFCDDECERVWRWLHEQKEEAAEEELGPRAKKALTRCQQFLRLAVDATTTEEERRSAAVRACNLLARHGFLDIVDRAAERFTPDDLMRWAERVGRERARGGG